jgi:hypothetical protein
MQHCVRASVLAVDGHDGLHISGQTAHPLERIGHQRAVWQLELDFVATRTLAEGSEQSDSNQHRGKG